MNGVEILNQYEDYTVLSNILICIFFVLMLVCLFSIISAHICDNDRLAIATLVAMLVFLACFILTLVKGSKKTVYQITISDDVSMTEFYEKYNVEDVRGKIYTVTEKEDK